MFYTSYDLGQGQLLAGAQLVKVNGHIHFYIKHGGPKQYCADYKCIHGRKKCPKVAVCSTNDIYVFERNRIKL